MLSSSTQTGRCSSAKETIIGNYICNEFEAGLVRELVLTVIKAQNVDNYKRFNSC